MRAACAGFFEIFISSAFGVAAAVVVVPVVVVPVVVPVVVVPVVVVPVVVPAVVVAGLFPTPGFDAFAAALFAAPLLPGLVLVLGEVFPETFCDWPWLVGAADVVGCLPPLGAAPDLPCAATGVTLTAAIAAAVAKSRNRFICVKSSPDPATLQEQCLARDPAKDKPLRQLRRCSTTAHAVGPQNCERTFEVGRTPVRTRPPRRYGERRNSPIDMTESHMTRLRLSLVAAFGAFLMVLPQAALAQYGAGELSAGWRVLNIEEQTFTAGWYADVLGNITSTFGVVAEVAGHYKTFDETRSVGAIQVAVSADARVHTFMGG